MVRWLVLGTVLVVAFPLALILFVGASPVAGLADADVAGGPSVLALADIPPDYLTLYLGAAQWGVLAGIGKVESNHGQRDDPVPSRLVK